MGRANMVLTGLRLFGGGRGSSPPSVWVAVPQYLLLSARLRPVNASRLLTEYQLGCAIPCALS